MTKKTQKPPAKPQAQSKSKKTSAPKKQDGGHINEEAEWQGIRQNWAEEQTQKASAHLLSFFDADEDEMPLSQHLLLVAIASFFIVFVIWANFATLDEVTRGEGKIIPSSEIQALQSLEAGIVEELLIREGDEVKAGQVLVRLSDIEATSDLGANQARYYGLLASITRLQAEADGKAILTFPDEVMKAAPGAVTDELNNFRAMKNQMQGQQNIIRQQLAQREQEIRETETRIADIRDVLRLQIEEKEIIEPLVARGSAAKLELLQLERTIREKRGELNTAEGALPRAKSAAREVRARLKEAESTAAATAQTELSAKQIELNEIKERLSALEDRQTRTEIKSPVNGTIKELSVNTVGGVVRPGEDLIQIVPKDDQLLAEVRIRPADIAFLYPTQQAIVKITAYDFSIYGGLKGELIDISADTIEDEKGQSFYRVRLRTHEDKLIRKGEVLPIIPGMVASVDILTGKKTVMQYLLKPFIKTLGNALTER